MIVRPMVVLTVTGTIAALTVTTGGAFLAEATGIDDGWLIIPSLIVYAAVGFAGGLRRPVSTAVWPGVIVTIIDSTLGLWIESQIDSDPLKISDSWDAAILPPIFMLVLAVNALVVLGGVGLGRWMVRRNMHPGVTQTLNVRDERLP